MSRKITEIGHKISEAVEHAGDSIKESLGMSSAPVDSIKEKSHQMQNRASEAGQAGSNLMGTGNTEGNLGRATGTGTGITGGILGENTGVSTGLASQTTSTTGTGSASAMRTGEGVHHAETGRKI